MLTSEKLISTPDREKNKIFPNWLGKIYCIINLTLSYFLFLSKITVPTYLLDILTQ
jgi:hypothetical protein